MALDQQKADQKAALDQKRYEEEVVRPLRGRTAQLPDDLPTRYAVDARMTGPEIEKRLREVRAYWTNKARSASHVGQVCQAFLRADERLRAEHGDQLADPAFWRRRRRDGDRARRRATDQLAAELSGFYGDLGLLTREQLAAAAGAHADLEADQAEQAASAAGLEVVAARELPGVNGASGVSRDAVRTLTDGLAAAGAPSVPALLHPEAGAFTLLDAFSATPAAPGGLDLAAVEARIEAVSRGRDTATSGPAKHVLGRLRTAAVQGVDLRTLSLVLLLEPARAQRAAGAVPSGLVRRLEAGRLAPREARRIVVHLLAESHRRRAHRSAHRAADAARGGPPRRGGAPARRAGRRGGRRGAPPARGADPRGRGAAGRGVRGAARRPPGPRRAEAARGAGGRRRPGGPGRGARPRPARPGHGRGGRPRRGRRADLLDRAAEPRRRRRVPGRAAHRPRPPRRRRRDGRRRRRRGPLHHRPGAAGGTPGALRGARRPGRRRGPVVGGRRERHRGPARRGRRDRRRAGGGRRALAGPPGRGGRPGATARGGRPRTR